VGLKKIFILFFTIFLISCGLFDDPDESKTSELQNTLEDNLQGQKGDYEDYFYPLHKKLDLKYTTNLNPELNNSDTLNLQTFPEYLLYISPDSTAYQSLMYDINSEEFITFSEVVNDDTTLSSTIVVSSPKHKDYSTFEWDSEINRYRGAQDVDHKSCEDSSIDDEFGDCLSVEYIGDFYFDQTENLIEVEDPFVFNKTIKVIDNISNSIYSYLDLSDFDTTLVEVCEPDSVWILDTAPEGIFNDGDSVRVDCDAYQDYIIYEYKFGVLAEDSIMFWNITENDTIIGELPNNVLIDINGDTIRTFVPDESYTLIDGSVVTPVNWVTLKDTVIKPYTDYKEINMLLENHIIDELTDDAYSYNIMKTNVGWMNNGLELNTSDYFIYRNDAEAIYELVYPSYFNYYGGVWDDQNEVFHDNGWTPHSGNMDSVLFYLPFRDGEVVEHEYSSTFNDSVNGNSAVYNIQTSYKVDYGDELLFNNLEINGNTFSDTTLMDIFKITKFASMTMVGSGVKYNEEQIYWVAHSLGIVKQQINYSWGDYEMVLGQEWIMNRYSESEASPSMIFNSLNELANAFGEEKFIPKKSSGIVKFAPTYRKGF